MSGLTCKYLKCKTEIALSQSANEPYSSAFVSKTKIVSEYTIYCAFPHGEFAVVYTESGNKSQVMMQYAENRKTNDV